MFGNKGIAHVSYRGGSLFLPAHSEYERELVVEEVLRESHLHGTVQVLLDDDRWLVRRLGRRRRVVCVGCGKTTGSACQSGSRGDAPFCVGCAVAGDLPPAHDHPSLLCAAS